MAQNYQNLIKSSSEQALLNSIKTYLPDLILSMQDLKSPTQHVVVNFYTAFLEELGANSANIGQIQMNQMTLVSHVDMYNATVPLLNLYYSVKHFLDNIGVSDFSFSDLVNPVQKRTVTHLQAVMHFVDYCDRTIGDMQTQLYEVTKTRKQRDELLGSIETLTDDINQKARERVKRQEKIKELGKVVEKDKQIFDELCIDKENKKQNMEEVKKKMSQDEEKEAHLIRIIRNMEDANRDLASMVVKSPEKLRLDLAHLNEKQKACIDNMKSLKRQFEDKVKLANIHEKENQKQKIRGEILNELLDFKKHLSDKRTKTESLLNQYEKLKECEGEIEQKISNEQLKSVGLKETVKEYKERKTNKDSDSKKTLSSLEQEYKSLMKLKKERTEHVHRIQLQINEYNDRFGDLTAEFNSYIELFKIKHQKICEVEDRLIPKYAETMEKLKTLESKPLSEKQIVR